MGAANAQRAAPLACIENRPYLLHFFLCRYLCNAPLYHCALLACPLAAIRLFYWVRLAYRQEQALDGEFVNAATALPLFGLDQHVTVWDDKTDTHCVLGWSASQVVLAFRGTASLQVGGLRE